MTSVSDVLDGAVDSGWKRASEIVCQLGGLACTRTKKLSPDVGGDLYFRSGLSAFCFVLAPLKKGDRKMSVESSSF